LNYISASTQDEITAALHTIKTRVLQSIRQFHETRLIPNAWRVGRPSKFPSAFVGDIEVIKIQNVSMYGVSLSGEICEHFGVSLSQTAANIIRVRQRFKYQAIRHDQLITPARFEDRVSFCQKAL
jgi:hypothetical protein